MVIYSHSRISTFEQCPLKFKFKYIDKLPPEIKSTIEGFLGKKVHEVLEWVYQEVAKGNSPELDDLMGKFIYFWNLGYNEEIRIVNEENNKDFYFNQGIKFLINYYTKNQPFLDNTIATESKILVDLDKSQKYQVIGYIDRLAYDPNTGIYEIHDYKTGNFLKSQEELDKDRQLALYSIAIKEKYPGAKDILLIWHFLAFNESIKSKRTLEELEKLKQDIIEIIERIESTKDFPAVPSVLCKWCEFGGYCSFKSCC
jgi:putative RecB family exonuclease